MKILCPEEIVSLGSYGTAKQAELPEFSGRSAYFASLSIISFN